MRAAPPAAAILLHLREAIAARTQLLSAYLGINWRNVSEKTVLDVGPAYGIWTVNADEAGAVVTAVGVS